MTVHDKTVMTEASSRRRTSKRAKKPPVASEMQADEEEGPMRAETTMYEPRVMASSPTEVLIHIALETVAIDITKAMVNSYAKDGWQLIAVTPVSPQRRLPAGLQYTYTRPL